MALPLARGRAPTVLRAEDAVDVARTAGIEWWQVGDRMVGP